MKKLFGGGKQKLLLLILISALVLAGCVPGDGKNTEANPAGFFWGIWHGWVAPVSLIISLFNSKIRVYEVANSGWWYDFGYYIAIVGGFGGISITRRIRKKRKAEEHD